MTHHSGSSDPTGDLGIKVIRGDRGFSRTATPAHELSLWEIFLHAFPRPGLTAEVRRYRWRNLPNLWRGLWRVLVARAFHINHAYGVLSLVYLNGLTGEQIDYGVVSMRVVTTAGVNKIVAVMNTTDATTGTTFKFHGLGTGNTAEASGDTALVTELTTEYNPNSTRATGTQTVGGSNNIYRTVATNTLDSGTPAVVEHGVFSASSAGTLLDRSVFAAVNMVGANADALQTTYDYTLNAGS